MWRSRGLEFLILAACAIAIVIPLRLFVLHSFVVEGSSMEPTFQHGEYLLIERLSYYFFSPKRGDVLVLTAPRGTGEVFIKRVIGLPGEKVVISQGEIRIVTEGGEILLNEPYILGNPNYTPLEIPLGKEDYFVLGDNRGYSSDSRSWGTVQKVNFIGKPLLRILPLPRFSVFPG